MYYIGLFLLTISSDAFCLGRFTSFKDGPVICVIYQGDTYDSTMSMSCINTGTVSKPETLDTGVISNNKLAQVERFTENGLICYAFKGNTYDSTAGLSCVKPS